jgi:hypothetical protein
LFFMNLCTGHLALLASAAFAASLRLSADPVPGATAAAVVAALGQPAGRLAIGDRVELRYPRGSVILEKGVVTSSTLISPAEWEKRERERIGGEKVKVESAAREAAEIAERRNKANAALALLIADPRWKDLTGEGRIETLARFAKVFPDADTSAVTKELARKRENRAEIANATARRAEASAEQARQNDAFYGLRTYNVIGGGKINGAYPDNYYPTTGASVTVSNGVIVVSPGYVPQGVTPRPVVITRPVPASQPVKKN